MNVFFLIERICILLKCILFKDQNFLFTNVTWAARRFKSPKTWLLVQQLVGTNNKEITKLRIIGVYAREPITMFPSQRDSITKGVSISYYQDVMLSHYCDVIMDAMASQITSLTIVYSIVHSGADQRKHQSSASLAFVRGLHRWPVNSPHKWPVTRKCFHVMTSSWIYGSNCIQYTWRNMHLVEA